MVQRSVFVPRDNPETVVDGEDALENVPEPFTKLQLPVAGKVGVFPTNDADVVGKQKDRSFPAFATGAFTSNTVIHT